LSALGQIIEKAGRKTLKARIAPKILHIGSVGYAIGII
jgi:hypothetical protein